MMRVVLRSGEDVGEIRAAASRHIDYCLALEFDRY